MNPFVLSLAPSLALSPWQATVAALSSPVGIALMLAAFAAAAVCTVLLFRAHVSTRPTEELAAKGESLGRLIRFERLMAKPLLIALYLLFALLVAFGTVALVVANLVALACSGAQAGVVAGPLLLGCLFGLIGMVVCEAVLRVVFELCWMVVATCKNTSLIKKRLSHGGETRPSECVQQGDACDASVQPPTDHGTRDDQGSREAPHEPNAPYAPHEPQDLDQPHRPDQPHVAANPQSIPGCTVIAESMVLRGDDEDARAHEILGEEVAVVADAEDAAESAGASVESAFGKAFEQATETATVRAGEAAIADEVEIPVEEAGGSDGESGWIASRPDETAECLGWTCRACGAPNDRGGFCSQCGTPRS